LTNVPSKAKGNKQSRECLSHKKHISQ